MKFRSSTAKILLFIGICGMVGYALKDYPSEWMNRKDVSEVSLSDLHGRTDRIERSTVRYIPGEVVQLEIDGLTMDQVKKAATTHYPRSGVTFIPAITWTDKIVLLFSADKPGTYLVGVYPILGDRVVPIEKEIVVEDGDDPPNPPDPDDEVIAGPVWAVIVEESSLRTQDVNASEEVVRTYCESYQDGRYRRVDKDQVNEHDTANAAYKRYFDAFNATDKTRPILFIVSNTTGKIVYNGALGSPAEVLEILRKYGG